MFPKVNYIGNKEKISQWIVSELPDDVETVIDAFSGGNSFSYSLKQNNYKVISNDVLYSSFVLSKALIENNDTFLSEDDIKNAEENDNITIDLSWLSDELFFTEEVLELEKLVSYAKDSLDGYKFYMFLALLRRAMIRKLPYSRMNVGWENIIKLRDEEYSYKKYGRKRAYHNKSFVYHMFNDLNNYNLSVFKGAKNSNSEQLDIFDLMKKYPNEDLIYLDPPYPGTMNNYDAFYGKFDYIFEKKIDHIDLTKKNTFIDEFKKILTIAKKNYKYALISLNNSVKPSFSDIENMAKEFGNVKVYSHKHNYQVSGVNKKNKNTEKLILINFKTFRTLSDNAD